MSSSPLVLVLVRILFLPLPSSSSSLFGVEDFFFVVFIWDRLFSGLGRDSITLLPPLGGAIVLMLVLLILLLLLVLLCRVVEKGLLVFLPSGVLRSRKSKGGFSFCFVVFLGRKRRPKP